MNKAQHRSPILVTGMHRTGTTFVGKMLSIGDEIGYIHEPFNKSYGLEGIDHWFLYLKEGLPNETVYASLIVDLLSGRATFKRPSERNPSFARLFLRKLLRSRAAIQYSLVVADPRVKRYLIKDPLACLASEYLHRFFSMDSVIIVRHPAAVVASLQRMNFQHDFSEFFNQPFLLKDHIGSVLENHDLQSLTQLEVGALFWKCIYSTLAKFAQRNPGMITVRHEDISVDPQSQFQCLYERLGIEFSARCRRKIEDYTRAANPTAAVEGRLHTLRRNSRGNVKRWKEQLSAKEVDRIRTLTSGVCDTFYSDDDW